MINWKHSLLGFLLGFLLMIFLSPLIALYLLPYPSILVLSIIMELFLLLIALLVGRLGLPWRELIQKIGFRKPSARWIALSFLWGALGWISAAALGGIIGFFFPYPPGMAEAQASILVQKSLLGFVLWSAHLFVFVGPCEEILFRGIIQRGFENSISKRWVAVLISSLLFAAVHLDLRGLLPRAFLGMVLGYLYIKSDYNIVVPSLAHGFNDFLATILLTIFYSS